MSGVVALAVGQKVRWLSNRWTPTGWEPVVDIATVITPCVTNDADYNGQVEIKVEGVINRVFAFHDELELVEDTEAPLTDTGNPPLAGSVAPDPAAKRDGRRVTPPLPTGDAGDIAADVRRFFGGE